MPRRPKTEFKGRLRRDLTSGRFYRSKGRMLQARKARVWIAQNREKAMTALRKAINASLTPECRRKTGLLYRAYLAKHPELVQKCKERLLYYYGTEKFICLNLDYYRSMGLVKDGKFVTKLTRTPREKSNEIKKVQTGVVRIGVSDNKDNKDKMDNKDNK